LLTALQGYGNKAQKTISQLHEKGERKNEKTRNAIWSIGIDFIGYVFDYLLCPKKGDTG
jgi:hypothetical protein